MNNFKRISAVILALCTAATIFASCDNNEKINNASTTAEEVEIIEIITEKETVAVEVTNEKGEVSVSVSEKVVTIPVTKKVTTVKNDKAENKAEATTKKPIVNHVTSQKNQITGTAATANQPKTSAAKKPVATTAKKAEVKTTATPVKTTVATSKRPVVDDIINEKSVGIFMMTKSDPVQIGNQATIIVQGTPGKTYSIDFYETPSNISKLSTLEDKKADKNGFVTWTFEINRSCNLGKRKIVIKEKNSSNYLETSITVR